MSTELRYNEYYNMQKSFDWLYERSLNQCTKGINLYEIITSKQNILLAYRIIKSNTGSKTAGIDNLTIKDFKIQSQDNFIEEIQKTLENYVPQPVRRILIPKPNGEKRPLGIPTMRDRLIQQMFKQVLEPICEAQFFKHSYGFRPNRSVEHALSRCKRMAYTSKCHYVVDVDIKGFFDNVHHGKLIKQAYNIGIKDKRVLAILSKMIKAPIRGEGVPKSGVPQGGILSPILSNIVLNDLDWWIANQWETFPSRHNYQNDYDKYRALKKTNLKEVHIIRYADDFKLFTKSYQEANKLLHATKGFIENQLGLEISTEKSKITNLRRNYSEFLGFELKVEKQKKNEFITISRVSNKAKVKIKQEIRKKIKKIRESPTIKNITHYNLYIRGIHNYYQKATRVSLDFGDLYSSCLPTFYNRLKNIARYEVPRSPPIGYKHFYSTTQRTFKVKGIYLYPLQDVKWKKLEFYNPKINDYTEEGRSYKFKRLKPDISSEIRKMCLSENIKGNLEFSDNRISKFSMQHGKCAITKEFLKSEFAHCHHIIPKELGGSDSFDNLVIIHEWVHLLIHATKEKTIKEYLTILQLDGKQLEKLNQYRQHCNLTAIH
ncbi:group II intron reverse transcriptase/maturase [Enterococcus gallinarum]|uniref:group II intron reverse transcriptase/maturase n=1 Tax=Enterococcus gallinarum TaxID=1353 RepID=UPI0015D0347C|nr:group II intron reverse transcriptase/maturase [Enterococcus gallinarum]MBF0724546.1 group II intron reverse transcriptase/maturase [Enterococcus gallinarum]NYS80647.1 group II intron reverse transcriptase/maturase [Enterococcus gallinarum]